MGDRESAMVGKQASRQAARDGDGDGDGMGWDGAEAEAELTLRTTRQLDF